MPSHSLDVLARLMPRIPERLVERAAELDYTALALTDINGVYGAVEAQRAGRLYGVKVLVGATVMREKDGFGDTAFTSVLATHRRRGVAQAVKAASILAFLDIGITRFSTGGAAANQASLQANQSLGYQLTEQWRTYAP